MSWQKYLLLPQVIWHAVRAPKGEVTTWERYWGDIDRTGEHGEVLWDAGIEPEMRHAREWLLRYADRTLPLVDVGCGNGRRTRALAPAFPSALGVDLSARAIERARAESRSDDPAAQARSIARAERSTPRALGKDGARARVRRPLPQPTSTRGRVRSA